MRNLQLLKDYKDNPQLRQSFNNLASLTFGVEFEKWYVRGFWSDRYVCYSFVENKEIFANVSINKMEKYLLYRSWTNYYYLPDWAKKLHIYELISEREVNFQSVINKMGNREIVEVIFHFSADFKDIEVKHEASVFDEVLFVKTSVELP